MSVEFRQRTPSEYVQILWRRKWLIIFPTIAISVAIAWVVWRLPDIYESTTLLTVRPSTIPNAIVPQLSDDDLTIRINNISQEVMSRSFLEPLIIRYNLYAGERQRRAPMNALIERMQKKDITVEVNKSRNDITNGFNISYRGPDPKTAQAVTAELAGKYISTQLQRTSETGTQTQKLFEEELKKAEDELSAIEQQRIQYMQAHVNSLPTQAAVMVQHLTGLREQQKGLITEIGRLRDQQTAYNTQLADLKKLAEKEIEDYAENVTDPKTTYAWAELIRRKAQFEAELQNLLTVYKPKHPDVLAKQSEIASIQRGMDQMIDEWKDKIREKQEKLSKKTETDPRINTVKYNIELVKGELDRQRKLLEQTNEQIAQIEQRVSNVPSTEVDLQSLDNKYKTKKTYYDELLSKKQKADLATTVALNAQGEKIQVIDPASLPEGPIAPKRPVLMGMGVAIGLAVGLLLALAFEGPRLLTIQTTEDAQHYTGLPVLVTVPELLTPKEERRLRWRRTLLAAAGIVATIGSIPVLALILKLTNIFELLAM